MRRTAVQKPEHASSNYTLGHFFVVICSQCERIFTAFVLRSLKLCEKEEFIVHSSLGSVQQQSRTPSIVFWIIVYEYQVLPPAEL